MCIGPTCLVPMATSRAIRWAARRMANGGSRRMSFASIAARMTAAAIKCGCPGRMSNLEGKACRPHSKEFCSRQRREIDLDGFGRLLVAREATLQVREVEAIADFLVAKVVKQ